MLISYVQNPERDKLTIANSTRIHNEEPRDMNLNSLIALISCQQSVIFRVCICYKTMYIYIYICNIFDWSSYQCLFNIHIFGNTWWWLLIICSMHSRGHRRTPSSHRLAFSIINTHIYSRMQFHTYVRAMHPLRHINIRWNE